MLLAAFHDAVTDLKMDPEFMGDPEDDPDKIFDRSLVEREDRALCNMLNYVRKQFKLRGYTVLLHRIQGRGTSPEKLWMKISQSPALLYAMQDVLKNTPRELGDIFKYGAEDNEHRTSEITEKEVARDKELASFLKGTTHEWMTSLDSQRKTLAENLTEEQKRTWNEQRHHLQ